MHGGSAIDHRCDLDLTLSDRLVDYSDERGPADTLYLIVDPDSAAIVLLTPILELLEKTDPRLPATFYSHFAGALNRWVRVYDYHDAEERVEMLREWYEGEENAEQYELPDVKGCTPKSLKEQPLSLCGLKKINEEVRDLQVRGLITGLLELCRAQNKPNGQSSARTWENNSWTRIQHCPVCLQCSHPVMLWWGALMKKARQLWR